MSTGAVSWKRDSNGHYRRRRTELLKLASAYLFQATGYVELLGKVDEAARIEHSKTADLAEFRKVLIAIERRPSDSELRREALRILEGL